jgi:hypothetical protein
MNRMSKEHKPMRFIPTLLAAASAALLVGAPATAARTDRAAAGEEKLAKALEGRVAGTPVSCIPLNQVRQSTVIDDTAILYRIGSKIYLNRPVNPTSLDDDDVLVTRTTGSQLCNLDVVRMVDRTMGFQRGFVSLSKFVPYTKVAQN